MVKSFYHRVLNTLLLLSTVGIGIILLVQWDHQERLLIENRRSTQAKRVEGQSNSNPTKGTLWSLSAVSGLLEPDFSKWVDSSVKPGGTLKGLIQADPKGFNYLIENSVDVSNIEQYNMTSLVMRHKEDVTRYAPGFATFLDRSPDFLTYRYRLRPDIFWHTPALDDDEELVWLTNGESCREVGARTAAYLKKNISAYRDVELKDDRHWVNGRCRTTAHDVMFWLRLLMNPQVGGAASSRSYFADLDLENSRVTGDFSLEIRFHNKKYKNDMIAKWLSATPEFLYAYDNSGERFEAPVLGKRFSEHWYNPRAIGNGPYRFVEFVPGTHLVLEKDPWFPLGGNAFDKLVFKVVKDQVQHPLMLMKSAAAQSEKENDGVHVTSLSPQSFRQVMKKTEKNTPFHDGSIQHSYFWSYGYSYIGWNADKAFFADKRVRRAMGLSLKAEEILTEIRFGLGERVTGPISPGLPHYDETLPALPYDLEQAGALLDAAGWRDTNGNGIRDKRIDGRRLEFEFTFNIVANPVHQDTAEVLKESLREIGVKCNLKAMEWANFQKEPS